MIFAEMNDSSILELVGARVRRERLNQNRTQDDISMSAGVALNVIKNLESGQGCTLSSFVRILRSLGQLEHLDLLLPDPGVSPIQLARAAGRQRREASGKRGRPARGR